MLIPQLSEAEAEAIQAMANALLVIILHPHLRPAMQFNDPKAWEQCVDAVMDAANLKLIDDPGMDFWTQDVP